MNPIVASFFIFLTLLIAIPKGYGQNTPAKFACYYSPNLSGDYLCNDLKALSFTDDLDAREILKKILEPVGLTPNFVLQPCDSIKNCVATIGENGWRYILYDRQFLKSLVEKDQNNWSAMSIFAHEVLHHLNQHTHLVQEASLQKRRQMELEADAWSGRILAMLGATLEQAQSAVSSLQYEFDETFSSHPSKEQRLIAIETGYRAGSAAANKRKPKATINLDNVTMKNHQFIKIDDLNDVNTHLQNDDWLLKNILKMNGDFYGFFTKSPNLLKAKLHTFKKLNDLTGCLQQTGNWFNSINFHDNEWIALQDSNETRINQTIRSSPKLDMNDINLRKAKGNIIRDLSFDNGTWVILEESTKSANVTDQILLETDAFPQEDISQFWENFFVVSVCKFVNNKWITIMHKYDNDQRVIIQRNGYKSTFPLNEFINLEANGFTLQSAGFDGNYWIYIMNQYKNFTYERVKQ
jgi:hypothetical protein